MSKVAPIMRSQANRANPLLKWSRARRQATQIGKQNAKNEPESWVWFIKAVFLCYERPDAAIARMSKYLRSKGENSFIAKLAGHPSYFGARFLGKRRSHEALSAQRLKEVKQAATLLPLLAKDALTVR